MKKRSGKTSLRCRLRPFTLVELLVAMAVFSVLLVVSMQVLASAQKLWTRSEQKNSTFSTARVTMEFIASRLQTMVYVEEMPFGIYEKSGDNGKKNSHLFFATAMKMDRYKDNGDPLDKYDMRFVGFQLATDSAYKGKLYMLIYADEGKNRKFQENFPPFDSVGEHKSRCDAIEGKLSAMLPSGDNFFDDAEKARNCVEIAENVIRFRCKAWNIKDSGKEQDTDAKIVNPPYVLEIEVTMLDSSASFKRWQDADNNDEKENIEREFGYTFRRAILLTDRR